MRKFLMKQSWYLALRKYWVAYRLINDKKNYLVKTGYLASHVHIASVGPDGNPVPWLVYPLVRFFEERLHKGIRVFEFGSGYSTRFYAERTQSIIALEHEDRWIDEVRRKLKNVTNAEVIFRPNDASYPRAIQEQEGLFDLVVVDGRQRVLCAKAAMEKLSEQGVLILDDAHREKYAEAIAFYKSHGFKALEFSGLQPLGFEMSSSVLFYRANNCVGL